MFLNLKSLNESLESLVEGYKRFETIQEIIDAMEVAEDYEDLFDAANGIENSKLRSEVESAIETCELDGDSVEEAASMVTTDHLDRLWLQMNDEELSDDPACDESEEFKGFREALDDQDEFIVRGYVAKFLPGDDTIEAETPEEDRELNYDLVFDRTFTNEDEAMRIAEQVAERISDVYGLNHVVVTDGYGDEIDLLTGPYNAGISPSLDDLQEDAKADRSKLAHRIRRNELEPVDTEYAKMLEINPSLEAEEGDYQIQFQDRTSNARHGYRIEKDRWGNDTLAGKLEKSPRVSSNTWGRVWKDGHLEKQFEGPKYQVRQDMARYLDNDSTEL